MASFKPMKVLHRCKITLPPGSVVSTCTTFPLTFFDITWLALPPVELLFFYEFPYPMSQFTNSLLPHLKHSLSSTLIHFYPLAGNLSWPHQPNHPVISYTEGDSVLFTVAESDADFYHLSSNHLRDAIEFRPLVPHLAASGPIIPLLALQVTVFPNTGICIATTQHHSTCDGRGFIHFMKKWAMISKFGAKYLSSESLPLLDRIVIKDPDNITKMYLEELDGFMGSESVSGNRRLRLMDIQLQPNMVRATFEINEATSKRLKEWVFNEYKKDDHRQPPSIPPSRFVAICAYTWVCLVKAEVKTGESKTNNTTLFVVGIDCRSRLDPPIPETYFGNCVRDCLVKAEKTDLLRGGVVLAAQLIGYEVHEVYKGILRGLEHSVSGLLKMESPLPEPPRVLAVGGSPQFGIYEIDFGFGRPKKVEMASIDRTGAMFMKESPNLDGGIEFDLVLKRQEMDAFFSIFVDGLNAVSEQSLCRSAPRSLL